MFQCILQAFALGIACTGLAPLFAQAQSIDVWPGDANNNGIVNGVDVLYWGFAYQSSGGVARAETSTVWAAQSGQAWGIAGTDGTDFAYADANGDGVVDHTDLNEAIYQNFGLTHGTVQADDFPSDNGGQGGEILLVPVNTPDGNDDTLFIDIMLGTETVPVQDFLGTTFELSFNPQFVADHPDAIRFELFPDAWIGSSPSETTTFLSKDVDAGLATLAMIRQNNDPVSGHGAVGRVSIVIEDISSLRPPFSFFLGLRKPLIAGSGHGPVYTRETDICLELSPPVTTNTASQRTDPRAVVLYPNPVRNAFYLKGLEGSPLAHTQVAVYNDEGRLLANYSPTIASEARPFWVHHLPAGTYVVHITSGDQTLTRQFIKR